MNSHQVAIEFIMNSHQVAIEFIMNSHQVAIEFIMNAHQVAILKLIITLRKTHQERAMSHSISSHASQFCP
nr:hypothetical protein BgiMline_005638 [Biomphalaria glabrata]